MEKFEDKILGTIVVYKDYIKRLIDDEGEEYFKQSNTRLPSYGLRSVGLCKFNRKILAAVAINYDKKNDERAVKFTIKQRLHTILKNDFDINPEDDGFTYVPEEYTNLLWKDSYTYRNLHGMIDPSYGQMIIKNL